MTELSTMTIIIPTVVFMSLMIIGILIGMSIHREATRRRRGRLHRRERVLAQMRGEDLARGLYTRDDLRRRSDRPTWV